MRSIWFYISHCLDRNQAWSWKVMMDERDVFACFWVKAKIPWPVARTRGSSGHNRGRGAVTLSERSGSES